MHYHLEVILPPWSDAEKGVEQVMAEFDEGNEESRRSAFWDWWVIGGRWAGEKMMAGYDKEKLDQFDKWMREEKITVSGIQWGKHELSPADQREKVDAKWTEMFEPQAGVVVACPIFKHAGSELQGDICRLGEVPGDFTAARIMFGKLGFDSESREFSRDAPLECGFMLSSEVWNGCNYEDTKWDGTMSSALEMCREHHSRYKEEWQAENNPTDDWLAVTVDYHS